jgi:hypothetical protein
MFRPYTVSSMPLALTWNELSDLIRALAALAWPAVAAFFLYLFRSDIGALISRIREGRIPGGFEFKLDKALETTREAADTLQPEPEAREEPPALPDDPVIEAALREAALSPRAALMSLSATIERRAREVIASTRTDAAFGEPFHRQIELLDLSPPLREAAQEFRQVRNRVVHGHNSTDEDALRAIDLGIELLRGIESIPHQVHYVQETGLDCFVDEEGRQLHDFKAVLLRSENPAGEGPAEEHAYPTTEPERFPKGEPVTWEWGIGGRVFPETWYRHPDGSIQYGWTEALEFRGRPLHH